MKKCLSYLLVSFLLISSLSISSMAQEKKDSKSETIKSQVARIGVGEKAKATVTLQNGRPVKGYIAQVGADDFVIRDRKTDSPTTVQYSEVAKVESNKGHSTARNVALGVGIGVGALLAVIAIALAHLD